MIAAVEPSGRTFGIRGGKPMLIAGAALLLTALVAAFWPHRVMLNGTDRGCDPLIADMVPSDPGPSYPEALIEACARIEHPERSIMLIGGVGGFLLGGLGLAGVVQQRAGRRALYWTPPPTWPRPPVGWRPDAHWVPPSEWPPAPANWQWWQPAYAGSDRANDAAGFN